MLQAEPLCQALAQVPGETPRLRMLRDPDDYARPVAFAVRP